MQEPVTVDCDYLFPRFAASYVWESDGEVCIVETNTSHAVPRILEAVSKAGVSLHQVKYVVVTHAHLDHAAGAGELLAHCPNAVLVAHPKAAKHLIDPKRLVEGATKVYGADRFLKMYGQVKPIDEKRVRVVSDGEVLRWGGRQFEFLHTLGHATHHVCVLDKDTRYMFTGDSFGLSYPDLQGQWGQAFIFPSTSPVDFDPEAALASVRRIAKLAKRAYLTHYGYVDKIDHCAQELCRSISYHASLLNEAYQKVLANEDAKTISGELQKKLWVYFLAELKGKGVSSSMKDLLSLDIELNADGIVAAAQKKIVNESALR